MHSDDGYMGGAYDTQGYEDPGGGAYRIRPRGRGIWPGNGVISLEQHFVYFSLKQHYVRVGVFGSRAPPTVL